MGAGPEIARKRARCVSWLTGQCHAGHECTCVPAVLSPGTESPIQVNGRDVPEALATPVLVGGE